MSTIRQTITSTHNFDYWLKKNWYYHGSLQRFYQYMIPDNSTVLQVGCKTGYLLNAVNPSRGVGIEEREIECLELARIKYSNCSFFTALDDIRDNQSFDYIILSSVCMETDDIQDFLQSLHKFCHPRTRIILDMYSFWWEPILHVGQKLGFRRPTQLKNWISAQDMKNFLSLSNFEVITSQSMLLLPIYVPFLSWFINSFIAQLPLINRFCLMEWMIARPANFTQNNYSVSVIVPCKNERGNILPLVQTCPIMGINTEIIFVEGNSSDGTYEEIQTIATAYSEKKIKLLKQTGFGKGNAVRTGFAHATGDILMILDGDDTVPATELPKFYNALAWQKADFVNGSRLVYGMETNAMRWLNLLANYLFGIGFSWLLGQPIKDTLCGTKVLFKKDYELIEKNRACFGEFDPFGDFDLLFGAAKLHLKILDMPVHYKARTYGTTQIRRFYHGLLLVKMSWIALKKIKLRL